MSNNEKRGDSANLNFITEVIKEAFLKVLNKKDFTEVTVTDICNEAAVSRGTFYKRFKNTMEIVNSILDDILPEIGNVALQPLSKHLDGCNDGTPLCLFVRKNKKYKSLFLSDSLFNHTIDKIVESRKDSFEQVLGKGAGQDVMQDLLYYQIMGCMSACKRHINDSDEDWEIRREHIDHILQSGFASILKKERNRIKENEKRTGSK